jgi:decaprenylphospho-beta-D-erythro-pentofuranosid-2-ulose 2-reductase
MTGVGAPPSVLILGATSDIGRAVARAFAAEGHALRLAARNPDRLETDAKDYRLRFGVEVSVHRFDALDASHHADLIDALPELPTLVVCAVGLLGEVRRAETDHEHATAIMRTNFEGPANAFAVLADRMARRGSGILVGISSVAGDRGRATNYVYGAAKAGFTAFLSGLRQRLAKEGVHVVTVKPGFVATRMTKDITLPGFLTAQPDEVAQAILHACRTRTDVIYVRGNWRGIMMFIRAIPERLFKRLNF